MPLSTRLSMYWISSYPFFTCCSILATICRSWLSSANFYSISCCLMIAWFFSARISSFVLLLSTFIFNIALPIPFWSIKIKVNIRLFFEIKNFLKFIYYCYNCISQISLLEKDWFQLFIEHLTSVFDSWSLFSLL